jgi:hypothetical protein
MVDSLKVELPDWTDWDVASHALGACLGLFPAESRMSDFKGVFWSDNLTGRMLYELLLELANKGVLKMRLEPDTQFRWNPEIEVEL